MANQIILAWKVLVAGTSLGPAGAAAALGAVPLYANPTTDPVLGQAFGLTVASDATTSDAVSATRTLTLNMTSVPGAPFAPPPFPCHPDTVGPPALPFTLRKTVTLAGSFLVTNGSAAVPTSATQVPALVHLDVVQFQSQLGVYYVVNTVGPTGITLTAPYTGINADGKAVQVLPAPAKVAALYSTSPLDTAGVATVPVIPAGSGARTVSVSYMDSTGAGPFTVVTSLTGKRPAAFVLAGGSIDVAVITDMHVVAVGGFGSSVGQITLAELSATLPAITANATPADFQALTDVAQLLILRGLAYLPPSYFALAQQTASQPQLTGDFFVTTGSASVPTSADQTGALAAGNVIQFASQLEDDSPFGTDPVTYTVATVTASPGGIGGLVTLTTPYTGLDRSKKYDSNNAPRPSNVTAVAQKQPTAAMLITPSPAAPPAAALLAAPLAQYVNPGTAVPPPNPPLPPGAMAPAPTFLSNMFTQTLSLALAVPVAPQVIAFA
jgi:hypothetical protein